jgi:hypothetical protein
VFEPAEYGVVTSLYAWTAFLNVVLTFGMETTFFRFANEGQRCTRRKAKRGRSHAPAILRSPLFPALAFMVLGTGFSGNIANGSVSRRLRQFRPDAGAHHRYRCASPPFPWRGCGNRDEPWRFAAINMISVAVNVGLNVFFILYCMKQYNAGESNALIDAVYDPSFGVGYVFPST